MVYVLCLSLLAFGTVQCVASVLARKNTYMLTHPLPVDMQGRTRKLSGCHNSERWCGTARRSKLTHASRNVLRASHPPSARRLCKACPIGWTETLPRGTAAPSTVSSSTTVSVILRASPYLAFPVTGCYVEWGWVLDAAAAFRRNAVRAQALETHGPRTVSTLACGC